MSQLLAFVSWAQGLDTLFPLEGTGFNTRARGGAKGPGLLNTMKTVNNAWTRDNYLKSGLQGGGRSALAGRAAARARDRALYIVGLRHWLLRVLAATARERSHPLCTPVR